MIRLSDGKYVHIIAIIVHLKQNTSQILRDIHQGNIIPQDLIFAISVQKTIKHYVKEVDT